MSNLAAERASKVLSFRRIPWKAMLTAMYPESEGSNATRHDPRAGDVLRQVVRAMDTASGAQVLALADPTDSVSGRVPVTLTSSLHPVLETQSKMNAHPPF
jgi:hypothetical protein